MLSDRHQQWLTSSSEGRQEIEQPCSELQDFSNFRFGAGIGRGFYMAAVLRVAEGVWGLGLR